MGRGFGAIREDKPIRADESVLTLRYMTFLAAISTLFYLLSAIRDYVAFLFLMLAGAVSIPILVHSTRFVRKQRRDDPIVRKLVLLLPLVSLLSLPYIMVLILGESGSPLWYIVYPVFLPAGLLISAHVAITFLAGVSSLGSRTPLYLGLVALLGSLGALVLTTWMIYYQDPQVYLVGTGLLVLGLSADVLLVVSARRLILQGKTSVSAGS